MQTVLQSDKDMGTLLGSNQNFERWIKHGFSTEDLVNSSNDSEEVLSQGGHSMPDPCFLQLLLLEGNGQLSCNPTEETKKKGALATQLLRP